MAAGHQESHPRRQIVDAEPAAGAGAVRCCLFEAAAALSAGNEIGRGWVEIVESGLEALASELEGPGDQALLLAGEGEDGDLRLSIEEVDAHASLRDYRAWLRTGAPSPSRRLEVRLRVSIVGPDRLVQEAITRLTTTMSDQFRLRSVSTAWQRADHARSVDFLATTAA